MTKFEMIKKENGFIIIDDEMNVVVRYEYGSRGGNWTATGKFNHKEYQIIKGNSEVLHYQIEFGLKNSGGYLPIFLNAHVNKEEELYVQVRRSTRAWTHDYCWQVVKK